MEDENQESLTSIYRTECSNQKGVKPCITMKNASASWKEEREGGSFIMWENHVWQRKLFILVGRQVTQCTAKGGSSDFTSFMAIENSSSLHSNFFIPVFVRRIKKSFFCREITRPEFCILGDFPPIYADWREVVWPDLIWKSHDFLLFLFFFLFDLWCPWIAGEGFFFALCDVAGKRREEAAQ